MNISQKKTFEFLSEIKDRSILPFNLWGQPGILESEIPGPENFNIADAGEACVSEDAFNNLRKFLSSGGSAAIKLNHGGETVTVQPMLYPLKGGFSYDLGLHYPLHFSSGIIPLETDRSKFTWKLFGQNQPGWKLSVSAADCAGNSISGGNEIASWMLTCCGRPASLNDILKDYKIDIYEFARLTRYEPGQMLGIHDIGHLKNGARANISVYDFHPDSNSAEIKNSLSRCWLLIKDGTITIKDGNFTGETPPAGPVISNIEIDIGPLVKSDLLQRSTLRWENLAVTNLK